jgi:hypothetical protein
MPRFKKCYKCGKKVNSKRKICIHTIYIRFIKTQLEQAGNFQLKHYIFVQINVGSYIDLVEKVYVPRS